MGWLNTISDEPWLIPKEPQSDDFVFIRGTRRPIATYRFIVAFYWSIWIVISILGSVGIHFPAIIFGDTDNDMDVKWLIFLTNWSLALLGTYLWTAFAASHRVTHSHRYLQLVWVLRNCTAVASLVVSVMFWTVIFPAIGHTSLTDVHCHGVNSLIVLVDLAISRLPYYFKHGWMPLFYLAIYLFFSVIYWLSGGTDPEGDHYIYPPLDYKHHPREAAGLVLVVVFVVVPLVHLLAYLYTQLFARRFLSARGNDPQQWTVENDGEKVNPLLPVHRTNYGESKACTESNIQL